MEILLLPKFLFNYLKFPGSGRYHFNILTSNILLVALFSTIHLKHIDILPHACLSKYLFGISCPGCGITTGLFDFFHLDIKGAYMSNPASIVIGSFIIIQVIIRFIAIQREKYSLMVVRTSAWSNHIITTLLLANFLINIF